MKNIIIRIGERKDILLLNLINFERDDNTNKKY